MSMTQVDFSEAGAVPYQYWTVRDNTAELTDGGVIKESLVTIFVNMQELATVMCTPLEQEALALGFLFNEGVIQSMDEVRLVKANSTGSAVDVFLQRADFETPRRMLLTSACGGGITLQFLTDAFPPLETSFATTPQTVISRMKDLQGAAHLYNQVRGVHTSILADKTEMLIGAEDIGRHNTLDKITGLALQRHIDTCDCMVLTSGRISSEMLSKARRMQAPLVASRTAPTSIAVQLAQAWNIRVVGYIRHNRMQVYTHPQRLGLDW